MRWRAVIGCLGLLLCLAARGQESRLPLPSDERRTLLSAADAAAASGDFAGAVERWQTAIDMPEDYFDPAVPRSSLRTRAEAKLLAAPAAALAVYETRFGPQARALLNESLRDDDARRLHEVVRRYFGTVAGHAAAALVAQQLADEGNALAAARMYDRLAGHPRTLPAQGAEWRLRSAVCWGVAGFGRTARERAASHSPPASEANNAAESSTASLSRDVQAWLTQLNGDSQSSDSATLRETTMFRGDPQRNGSFSPAAPVGPLAWTAPVVDRSDSYDQYDASADPRTQEVVRRMRRLAESTAAREPDRLLFPAGVPLTAGGLVIFRGPASVKAVFADTGKLAWSCRHADDTFHHLLDQEWIRRDEEWFGPNLDLLLTQRMWRDASAAALSTDGRLVYSITDGGMVSPIVQSAVSLPALSDHPLAPHANNRLLAIELRSGRIRWVLGGPVTKEPLSGAFFLGAPLPLDGELYCLVEIQGQVQLVVLDPETHAVVWSQALYNPNANLSNPAAGMARRMAGLAPSAAGELVICPTGETTVVAVDRLRRSLVWTFEYQRPISETPQQALMMRMALARQQLRARIEDQLNDDLLRTDHWQDATVVIANEHALLTLPDSQDLICITLLEGREVWRQPRGRRQAIAAVHQGNAVLIGQEAVEAVRIDTGEPAWQAPLPIPGPTGRGFHHGQWYVLPLARGEVATIDLETGRMVARSQLPEDCQRGNFVAADGRIVSQTTSGVQAFRSLADLSRDTEQLLAANGDDARALLTRGEVRLHLGDEQAGLTDLRRAVELDPQSPARRLLATTLIEGLRTDFDAYRAAAAEIESLATVPADLATFHRLFAAGLQQRGEVEAAFRQYLRFAESVNGLAALQRIDGARQVRGDNWISGRLEELLESVSGEARDRLQRELTRTVDAAIAANEQARLETLRRIIPAPDERVRIDRQQARAGSVPDTQLEARLLELLAASDPATANEAAARLADRWLAAGRPSDLLDRLLQQLNGPLSDVPVVEGKTGRELLTAWGNDPQRAAMIDAPDPWPTAHVSAHEQSQNVPGQLFPVRHLGPLSPLLGGWSFFTDAQGSRLAAFDRDGRQVWQTPTGTTALRGKRGTSYIRYITTHGRHLLLVVEDQWVLLDAFGNGEQPVSVVASELLVSEGGGAGVIPTMPRMNQPGRLRNRPWSDAQGNLAPAGNVGPISRGMFVYQTGSRLTAVNAATGEKLWTHDRPEVAGGADIVSDGDVVVVWPTETAELRLFRAVDGAALGAVPVPRQVANPQPEGYWGSRLVTLDRGFDGRRFALGMFDPLSRTSLWQTELEGVVDWGVVNGRDFYFLQKDQRLTVVDGWTGRTLHSWTLPDGSEAELATVWSDSDRWYVATYGMPAEGNRLNDSQPAPLPAVNGIVMAASRATGDIQWSVPVQLQRWHHDLPGRWPFLLFSSNVQRIAKSESGRAATWSSALLLLEKRSGRVLFEGTSPGREERRGWVSDPDEHRVRLGFGSGAVSLTFSDSAPTEPDADSPGPGQ